MPELSKVSNQLKGQEMFQILAEAQELEKGGKDILHFELGDPDFNTPKNIVNAACDSLKRGDTHYTNSKGLIELKTAAADAMERGRRGFRPSLDQLLVTPSANIQLDYAITCTTNPGEEIIIPDPGFVSYSSIISLRGAKAIKIPLKEENEFRLSPTDVEKVITDKTRMIIINSPSNPTGGVLREQEIRDIYDLAKKHDLWLLSDEIYTRIIYEDKEKFFSPSMIDKCNERTIIVNGFSKAYAMTGWRLGIVTAPRNLIEKMNLTLETTCSCVSPFIQRAGVEALKGSQQLVREMVEEYRRRRNLLVEGLNSINGINCLNPKGAFYAFPNIKKTGMSSREFATFMLKEAGVALAPGIVFGESGEGYVRMAYANSIENIQRGVERMREALNHPNQNSFY